MGGEEKVLESRRVGNLTQRRCCSLCPPQLVLWTEDSLSGLLHHSVLLDLPTKYDENTLRGGERDRLTSMDVRGFEPYQQTLKVGVKSKQETINVKHMNTI